LQGFYDEMLGLLKSPTITIKCVDVIDVTSGFNEWTERAKRALKKLDKVYNNTAGPVSKLTIAVGARVMLRCNIDTASGLVNGAIGTVLAITSKRVKVQFDNRNEPYDVKKVNCKFSVMKCIHIFRAHFPLILSFAINIKDSLWTVLSSICLIKFLLIKFLLMVWHM
uniref:DNA helicase Pif1-like 2B domain-containing protein n=1 Tax=Amphimedon queenslandica TaxID=400682 RepID=A0A1X7VVN9_AMPQE